MLIEFRVKNFRSFCDEQVFSMVASSDNSLLDNTVTVDKFGGRRILNSAVVYGANASGKSNFILAFDFMEKFICNSADTSPGKINIKVKPFLLDQSARNQPSEFEMTFMHEKVRYQYGFVLDEEKVYSEWLIAYPLNMPQKWFERTLELSTGESEWYFGPKLKGEKVNLISLTRPDVLFLSVAAKFNHKQLTKVFEWFQNKIYVYPNIRDYEFLEMKTAMAALQNPDMHDAVIKFLRVADLGVTDFFVENKKFRESDMLGIPDEFRSILAGKDYKEIKIKHSTAVDDNLTIFPISDESSGTRRYFGLSSLWLSSLRHGDVLIIDELDSSLHPILVKFLVEMYHDPNVNKKGAQLILNTHDTNLLDQAIFRRDQVWFTEKDRFGKTSVNSLLEYSPRKDESLSKGYLHGRYGAIPFLGSFSWGENDGEKG